MRRFAVMSVLLLLCIALRIPMEAIDQKPSVDMTKMSHIFLGWVDLDPEEFAVLGYSKADWVDVISSENATFQRSCTNYLPGRSIAAAKNKGDEIAAGNDLYVKFSDVSFDRHYRLHLSIHFIDVKTNSEIASVPLQTHSAHLCGLVGCLEKELEEVNKELKAQIAPEGKKRK